FKISRGIRQGCPLSHSLSILVVNELSLALQDAIDNNRLSGISLSPQCPPIHSLMFEDDLLMCGTTTKQEAEVILQILNHLCSL
uniref:Reverse transcriptase domain-containing protein n=1 Tax=Triticum urartu TaxID=4572 RepID=A0A8R7PN28_TRIUA